MDKQLCVSDSGKYVYSLMVFGKADLAARYFVQGTVFLNYNTEAFGDSIVSRNKVSITKGYHFTDSAYHVYYGDDDEDGFVVTL